MLWGAAAVSLPIILHFMHRRKPKVVKFPAMRFILKSHKATAAASKLKNLLLLLLRIAVIALFVMLLARPFLKSQTFVGPGAKSLVTAVLVLDNSFSMGYQEGEQTRFARAKETAREILDTFAPRSKAALMLASDTPQMAADFTLDIDSIRHKLKAAKLSNRATNLRAALGRAFALLKEKVGRNRTVFLLSDFAGNAWPGGTLEARSKQAPSVYAFDVAQEEARNGAVLDVELATSRTFAARPLEIRCRIARPVSDAPCRVELYLDGEKQDRKVLSPGGGDVVTFVSRIDQVGYHAGTIKILEKDDLPVDNERHFVAEIEGPLKVLAVNGDPARQASLDELFFLANALSPAGLGKEQSVLCRVCEVDELAAQDLNPYRCLILANVRSLADEQWRRIEGLVAGGGGLIVFAGSKLDIEHYRPHCFDELALHKGLLPGSPVRVVQNEPPIHIKSPDYSHPFLRNFRGGKNGDLTAPKFSSYLRVELPKDDPTANMILEFGNGEPALIEKAYGEGKVLLFTSTCDTDWTDLPKVFVFVPFVHEMLDYFRGEGIEALHLPIGAPINLALRNVDASMKVATRGPDDSKWQEATPQQKGAASSVTISPTERPGCYYVRRTGAGSGQAETYAFAVNLDSAESNLGKMDTAALASQLPGYRCKVVTSIKELRDETRTAALGKDLMRAILPLIVIFMIAESFLSNRLERKVAGE